MTTRGSSSSSSKATPRSRPTPEVARPLARGQPIVVAARADPANGKRRQGSHDAEPAGVRRTTEDIRGSAPSVALVRGPAVRDTRTVGTTRKPMSYDECRYLVTESLGRSEDEGDWLTGTVGMGLLQVPDYLNRHLGTKASGLAMIKNIVNFLPAKSEDGPEVLYTGTCDAMYDPQIAKWKELADVLRSLKVNQDLQTVRRWHIPFPDRKVTSIFLCMCQIMLAELQAQGAGWSGSAPHGASQAPPRDSGSTSSSVPGTLLPMTDAQRSKYNSLLRAVTAMVIISTPVVGIRVGSVKATPWCVKETPTAMQVLSDNDNGGDAEFMIMLCAAVEHGRPKGGVSALYVCPNPLSVLLKSPHVSDVCAPMFPMSWVRT